MTEPRRTESLQLPNLSIRGFAGIGDLAINHLGRVTLIAGMNGVGKTTLLDAVRLFAERGSSSSIIDILERRDELFEYIDVDGDSVSGIRWASLFHGRQIRADSMICIGPREPQDQLELKVRPPTSEELADSQVDLDHLGDGDLWTLEARHSDREHTTLMSPVRSGRSFRTMPGFLRRPLPPQHASGTVCTSFGPGLFSNRRMQALWASVALTDAESRAVEALNFVNQELSPIERIAVVGDTEFVETRTIVRRLDEEQPIPLKSLGDGAVRLFGVALALANSRDGFLLIDEVENGIHHSVQDRFWEMILHTAHANNVQVLATTHSWDAVAGYARAASQVEEVEGRLVRIERRGEKMRAVEYTEDDLVRIAETGSEVR